MKILISYMQSVLPKHNHGGALKIFKKIVSYLSTHGDQVTVVCNRRSDNFQPYDLYPNVHILPILHFKETFPDPYATAPFYLAEAMEIVYRLGQSHDCAFIYDSNLIFTEVFSTTKPLVYSLRDFVYSQALQGAFLIRRGRVIVNSVFVQESLCATAGRFLPGLKERITLIQNGIDVSHFRRVDSSNMCQEMHLSKQDSPILLFPHRPELEKGFLAALQVLEVLVKEYRLVNTKLLIARGIDESVSSEVRAFYANFAEEAKNRNVFPNLVFYSWLSEARMPEYFSLGTVTLCLGTIPEAFGSNTALESLACGTPVIANNIAAYRTTLPDWCLTKVMPGEIHRVAETIVSIIEGTYEFPNSAIRDFIRRNFNNDGMSVPRRHHALYP
ncbi:MAG: glycosyltransferase family 4 protein [Aggregatilineales bacterium]